MNVSVVTAADIKAKAYGIRDVVLPLPGRAVSLTLPPNRVGKYFLRLLRKEGIYDTVCCDSGGGGEENKNATAVQSGARSYLIRRGAGGHRDE